MTTGHRGRRLQIQVLLVGIGTLLVCVVPATAQQTAEAVREATPWTHQDYANDPNEFQFAIVSDKAAHPREGVFEAGLAKLQLLRPEFVLSVGDFIHGYDEAFKPLTDEDVVREKRDEFDEALRTLAIPFYRVSGNHDINNDLSARIWKELYGPDYYSFDYKGVLFLCLNSQDGKNYGPGIGKEQIAWVKDVLAKNNHTRWVFLFFHQPLWLEDEKRLERAKTQDGATQLTGFDEIEKLLEGRQYTVFAGHHHRYGKWVKNGKKYFRLATTGGQSALGGPEVGQFDHVMWITMTSQGPVVCNLLLEGILDEDAKTNMPATPAEGE
jgi:hypothetical protein